MLPSSHSLAQPGEWPTRDGAKYQITLAFVVVLGVACVPVEKRQLGGFWKLDKLPPVPMIEIDTTSLAVNANLVYHLLRFYIENSAARSELDTGTSLQLARAGNVPVANARGMRLDWYLGCLSAGDASRLVTVSGLEWQVAQPEQCDQ